MLIFTYKPRKIKNMSEQQLGLRAQPINEVGTPPDWALPAGLSAEGQGKQPDDEKTVVQPVTAYTEGAKVVFNSDKDWYKDEAGESMDAEAQSTVEGLAPKNPTAYELGARVVLNSGAERHEVEESDPTVNDTEEPSTLTTVEYQYSPQQPIPELSVPIIPTAQSQLPTAIDQKSDW